MLHVNIGSRGIVGRVCSVSTNTRTLLRTDRHIMSKPTVIRGAEAGVNCIHPDQPRVGGRPHLLTESGIWQTLEAREGHGDRTGAGTNGEMEVGTLMRSWVVYQKSFRLIKHMINDVWRNGGYSNDDWLFWSGWEIVTLMINFIDWWRLFWWRGLLWL